MTEATYTGRAPGIKVEGVELRRNEPTEVPDEVAELLRDRDDVTLDGAEPSTFNPPADPAGDDEEGEIG